MVKVIIHHGWNWNGSTANAYNTKEILKKTKEMMGYTNTIWWYSAGTALGLHRDGKVIPHDTDIDVEVFVQYGYEPNNVRKIFKDWKLVREMQHENRVMQLCYETPEGFLYDIYFYYRQGNTLYNWNDLGKLHLPLRFIQGLDDTHLPNPIEDYLKFRFGDWKKPVGKNGNWGETCGEALLK